MEKNSFDWKETPSLENISSYLAQMFEKWKSSRKNATLRLLAKRSMVSHSYLSSVLSGKKRPSLKALSAISKAMGVRDEDFLVLTLLQSLTSTKDKNTRDLILRRLSELQYLKKRVIINSDPLELTWLAALLFEYKCAALCTLSAEGIQSRIRFKVSKTAVARALKALRQVDLKDVWGQGRHILVMPEQSPDSMRTLQKQCLRVATEALDKIDPKERFVSSTMLSIDRRHLQEIFEEIRRFRSSLCERFSIHNESATDVYQLSVQVFPVMQI